MKLLQILHLHHIGDRPVFIASNVGSRSNMLVVTDDYAWIEGIVRSSKMKLSAGWTERLNRTTF